MLRFSKGASSIFEPPELQPFVRISLQELIGSTSRRIVLGVASPLILLQLLVAARWPGQYAYALGQTSILLLLVVVGTLVVERSYYRSAQILWLTGYSLTVFLAVYLMQQTVLLVLLILTPIMAALMMGGAVAILTELVVVFACVWFVRSGLLPHVNSVEGTLLIATGAIATLVAWLNSDALLTMVRHSLYDVERVRNQIEEAREHQIELKQIQEDLLHANLELARLSDRLKAMNEVAEDARRVKEEFVANVSHELRTPLNMIIGFSEMITRSPEIYGSELPPALLSDISAIQQNSQHLAGMINDVLDLSRVEAGRMALSKETSDLNQIVHEAVDAVRALFETKQLYLTIDDNLDLPLVACDPTRVRQVIINLLSNAGRFTRQGGVDITMAYAEELVTVSVRDTGPGVSLERQAVMFEPFQQLDGSIYRRYGGSGLGLSISRKIVEMHGGKMWVESKVGAGTCVSFSLPTFKPASFNPAVRSRGNGTSVWLNPYEPYEPRVRRFKAQVPALTPRYVLLEEGKALASLLSRYADEVEVEHVRDIAQALDTLQQSPAQAVVVNGSSNDGKGWSTADMAEIPFGTPVFNCWIPDEDAEFRRFGVARHLIKPVTRDVLLEAIGQVDPEVKTILVVDDNAEFLQLFGRMLSTSSKPYQVLRAASGRRALDLLRTRRPDLMLLDLVMPKMDGFQVLNEKRHDETIREIPVIVVSSQDAGGEPVVSNSLTISRGGGVSAPDLLACIEAVSEILAPSVRQPGSAHQERSDA